MTKSASRVVGRLALPVLLLAAAVAEAREVRVGYGSNGGYHVRKPDGAETGLGYEICELLAGKAGWTNRYVAIDGGRRELEKKLADGEVDVLDFVRRTPEREADFGYSAQPAGYSYGRVLVRTNETRYAEGDCANWGRVAVGAAAGGDVGRDFTDFAALHGFTPVVREFGDDAAVLEALRAGRVDMAVVEATFHDDTGEFRTVDELSPRPCYFCVRKDDGKLLRGINRAMAAAYDENPAWGVDLRRKYLKLRQVVVYLPRRRLYYVTHTRYVRAMANLLAAIGNWEPVFRSCAEDYSDADFSVPCIAAHVYRTPENLKRFDFPFVTTGRRPIYLACDPSDLKFLDGMPKGAGALKIGYDRTDSEGLRCFLEYAEHRNVAYKLVPYDSAAALGAAVKTPAVDLAVIGFSQGDLRRIAGCGSVEFDFATPREQPALRRNLDLSSRYMRYHEGKFLRNLERYAYGAQDASHVVRAGVYPEFGGIDVAEDGSVSGFVADYLREIARFRNWDLIFVPMTYSEVFECLAAGEIDVAPVSGPCPEPSELYDVSKRETGIVRYALTVRTDSALQPNRPDLWTGNRIGYLAGARPVDELRRYLDGIGAKYRLVPYTGVHEARTDVRNGKLDGLFTIHAREAEDFRTIAVFPSVHSYFCTNRKRPGVKKDVDAAIDYFASNNFDFNWWLNNFYLRGTREILMLDPDEIAYVGRNRGRKVVVGFPETVEPVSRFDGETGRAGGFLAALFREIAEKAGLEVTFTGGGRADVYVTQRESMDGRGDLVRNREWYPLPSVRVSLPSDRIPDAARGIWAVESNRVDEIEYLRQCSHRVLKCGSREECYRAVTEGRAEATIDNFGTARLLIDERREFAGLQPLRIDPAQWARQVALSFSPETDPELRSILVKARVAISPSAAEKMLVDAIVECRRSRFSTEDLVLYGTVTGFLVLLLLGAGYGLMYVRKQRQMAEARTRFFFNVSHDVRTPIHAIMGFNDIALSNLDDREKVRDCLIKTRGASGLLLSLIKSVLDMSRIEAGKVKLEEQVGDVRLSFVDVESTLLELAKEKQIDLRFEFGEIADRYVYADYELCTRVFVNVITNAVKYTPNGGKVRVICEQIGKKVEKGGGGGQRNEDSNHLCPPPPSISTSVATYRYTFQDNGIGMSEEFQKRLYDKFAREQNTTMSGVSGLGLGMSIAKSFVDLLGGSIECRSRQGEGTTFTVILPFRLQEGRKYVDPVTGAVRDAGEDEKLRSCEVEKLRSCEVEKLRSCEYSQPPNPSTSQPLNLSTSQPPRYAGKRVLLVDDSKLNREVARHYLAQAGFTVDTAENGQEAVDKVTGQRSKAKGQTAEVKPLTSDLGPLTSSSYDLILMDIQMPVMDGLGATRAIRAWEKGQRSKVKGQTAEVKPLTSDLGPLTSHIPIIAWTANAFEEDREAAAAAGMDGLVAKGVKASALQEEIAKFL